MCIVLWSLSHKEYQLVLISNRDEYLARPTLPARWHTFSSLSSPGSLSSEGASSDPSPPSSDSLLGGLDLSAWGTWLGVTPRGRIGLLTNVAEPADPNAPSRGLLVRDYLTSSSQDPDSYAKSVNSKKSEYAGFNLVIGQLGLSGAKLAYVTNREDPDLGVQMLEAGGRGGGGGGGQTAKGMTCCDAVGVSNNTLGDQEWIKVARGEELLDGTLKESEGVEADELIDRLFQVLGTTDPETEFMPSNILIRPTHRITSPGASPSRKTWYATRSQCIVLVTRSAASTKPPRAIFVEREAYRLPPEGEEGEPRFVGDDKRRWRRFEFDLDMTPDSQTTARQWNASL